MKNGIVSKGVALTVENVNGNLLITDKFGCLGELDAGKVILKIKIDCEQRVRGEFFGLERQGNTHAILKRDWTQLEGKRIYKRIIDIWEGDKGSYVAYPGNHLKLLEVYKNGAFKIWEVGITMRGNLFYLVSQAVWSEKAYRDGDTVVLPAISDWVSLRKVMFMTGAERQELEDNRGKKKFVAIVPRGHENLLALKDLEPVSKYIPKSEISADGLDENQGLVTWWNDCHGIGSIITLKGSARIHRNNLTYRDELVSFEKGDLVEYDELIQPDDPRSKFTFEAIGVKLPTFEQLATEMLVCLLNQNEMCRG